MNRPIFVYGTLRWQCGNDRLWHGRAVSHHDGTAYVLGYALVNQGAFPYLVPAASAQTVGGLIVPDDEHYDTVLSDMDDLEGVPHHYRRITTPVIVPGKVRITTAWTYLPARISERIANLPDVPMHEGRYDWRLASRLITTNERNHR